jgi:dihydrofolate reductase
MTERRIVMFNQVSADGFFSDSEGGLDWVVSDPELHRRAVASMPHTDTLLLGRRTYENFAAFWPGALNDLKKAGPHGENKADPGFLAMAEWLNETKKLVASRTLSRVEWNNSELIPELEPSVVRSLKRQPGRGILIFGSGTLVSQLTEARLIDEYRFVVCPVLLGSGHSLLRGVSSRLQVHLAEAAPLPSGNVLLTYTSAPNG